MIVQNKVWKSRVKEYRYCLRFAINNVTYLNGTKMNDLKLGEYQTLLLELE